MDTATQPVKRRRRHVGDNIRHIRKTMGMSQKDLAEKMHTAQQTLSEIENSEEVSEQHLESVAKALGISTDVILDYEHENTVNYIITNNTITNNNENSNTSGINLESTPHHTSTINYPIEEVVQLYKELLESHQKNVEIFTQKVEELIKKNR